MHPSTIIHGFECRRDQIPVGAPDAFTIPNSTEQSVCYRTYRCTRHRSPVCGFSSSVLLRADRAERPLRRPATSARQPGTPDRTQELERWENPDRGSDRRSDREIRGHLGDRFGDRCPDPQLRLPLRRTAISQGRESGSSWHFPMVGEHVPVQSHQLIIFAASHLYAGAHCRRLHDRQLPQGLGSRLAARASAPCRYGCAAVRRPPAGPPADGFYSAAH
jgi:hypothetical protein